MLKSVDTNILLYAVNRSCAEHKKAVKIYQEVLDSPYEWIIADQVLFEFYTALQNPAVLSRPLSTAGALEQIKFLREESGVMFCAYEVTLWKSLIELLGASKSKKRIIFDYVLAATLKSHGVTSFFTRNKRDFVELGLFEVVDPLG